MTAFLENNNVCVLFLGRESLAKTIPTMNACSITPVIDWIHMTNTASGHSSVGCFDPYLRYFSLRLDVPFSVRVTSLRVSFFSYRTKTCTNTRGDPMWRIMEYLCAKFLYNNLRYAFLPFPSLHRSYAFQRKNYPRIGGWNRTVQLIKRGGEGIYIYIVFQRRLSVVF